MARTVNRLRGHWTWVVVACWALAALAGYVMTVWLVANEWLRLAAQEGLVIALVVGAVAMVSIPEHGSRDDQ